MVEEEDPLSPHQDRGAASSPPTQTDMVATVPEEVAKEANVLEKENPLIRTKIVVRLPKSDGAARDSGKRYGRGSERGDAGGSGGAD